MIFTEVAMTQLDTECVERTVRVGDTVTLIFGGEGQHIEGPYAFEVVEPNGNDLCWSKLLIGKKAGATITLPEKEGNEVYGTIKCIDRN